MSLGSADTVYVPGRKQWRAWLQKNHQTSLGIWLIYCKKGSGKPRVSYDDAVEEAICFGWIDSTVKRIDEEKYAQKFTPRRTNSQWSELNVKRAEKMISLGLMTEAGLSKYQAGTAGEKVIKARDSSTPSNLLAALAKNPQALNYFNRLSPSHKKWYCVWINDAKREETRHRRIKQSFELLSQGKKLSEKWFSRG